MKSQMSISVLIGITLVIAIIVFVVIFNVFGVNDLLKKLGNFIPKDNQPEKQEGAQLIRYSLVGESVEFYDGDNWLQITEEKKIEDKKLTPEKIKNDFESFYYDYSSRENLRINDFSKLRTIYSGQEIIGDIPAVKACIINGIDFIYTDELGENKYDIIMNIIKRNIDDCTSTSYGRIKIDLDEKVEVRKVSQITAPYDEPILESSYSDLESPEVKEKLIEISRNWRNSILKNPLALNYEEEQEDSYVEKINKFCVELYDNKYLVVDLSVQKETC